jgi:formylmethanofuran dehydrogenase subunit E
MSIVKCVKGKTVMKKEFYLKTLIVTLMVGLCLISLNGCKKSSDKTVKTIELIVQIEPLKICRIGSDIETITLNQAMKWHESHEHEQHTLEKETATTPEAEMQTPQEHQHFCLGVLTGYQAIRYATDKLFQDGIPKASDFDIKVSGSMNGVWDVLSLYTGRELKFDGQPEKMGLESYTFTAKRIDQNKVLIFRLRQGLISEEFFKLKNQGATCSDPAIRKIKQQALLNILSTEPEKCFDIININCSRL